MLSNLLFKKNIYLLNLYKLKSRLLRKKLRKLILLLKLQIENLSPKSRILKKSYEYLLLISKSSSLKTRSETRKIGNSLSIVILIVVDSVGCLKNLYYYSVAACYGSVDSYGLTDSFDYYYEAIEPLDDLELHDWHEPIECR